MSYAFVDDIPYRKWGALYRGEQLVEHVPRLAICLNLGNDIGPLLFHCDEEWNTLGRSGAGTIVEVTDRRAVAERANAARGGRRGQFRHRIGSGGALVPKFCEVVQLGRAA
jgi:hypothetical protein